jgi:ABC-2 type transport system ATP-binding protein
MIIETKDLNKKFQSKQVLDHININITKGSIFGLLGPNGAGKTTFIRLLTKIIEPDSGEILFEGKPLLMSDVYQMGYLPEERGLYKKMGVEEQLLFFASLKNIPNNQAKKAIKNWAEKFDLGKLLKKPAEELSKGMQQKVQLMASLLHNPKLLILDEPFSGFDPIHAQLLQEEIIALKEQGTSIVLSSHRMDTVEQLCDHLALINQGKVILDGELEEIQKAYSKQEWILEYDGELPQTNELFKIDCLKDSKEKRVLIKPIGKVSLNEMLAVLLNKGISIKSIKEQKPNMNTIFIDAVAQTQK